MSTIIHFRCEACGTEKRLRLQEFERVDCDCGASYIAWGAPLRLKCVVRPIFKESGVKITRRSKP